MLNIDVFEKEELKDLSLEAYTDLVNDSIEARLSKIEYALMMLEDERLCILNDCFKSEPMEYHSFYLDRYNLYNPDELY